MLTFGSDEMQLDAAWEWRQLLRKHIRPEPTGDAFWPSPSRTAMHWGACAHLMVVQDRDVIP